MYMINIDQHHAIIFIVRVIPIIYFIINNYPRKGQRYTLLLDGDLVKGWAQRTAGSSLCAMIKKIIS